MAIGEGDCGRPTHAGNMVSGPAMRFRGRIGL